MKREVKHILFTTSTLPHGYNDSAPSFVRDEAIWFKKTQKNLRISILAPHNGHNHTKAFVQHEHYSEYRFHYFWPFRLEKLTGRGIQPALKKNKLLYVELPGLFLFEFLATLRFTKKHKPDLIYAHWFTPQAITTALVSKLTNVPFVFDTQASDAIVLKNVPFAKKIVAWVCENALSYTAPSNQTINKLLYFSTQKNRDQMLAKLHKIPYGTSPPKVDETTVAQVKRKYNLDGKKVLYFIGRLVDRKGVDILLKAFEPMAKEDPELRLVLVGDGQDRQKLKKLSKDLGVSSQTIFTGFVNGDERFALLKIATVCVIPSLNVGNQSEGLPVVFMEAISYGKITVLTDATGAHEVADNNVNAFICKSGSIKDLRRSMYHALGIRNSSEYPQFEASIKALSKEFQWSTIARQRFNAFTKNLE